MATVEYIFVIKGPYHGSASNHRCALGAAHVLRQQADDLLAFGHRQTCLMWRRWRRRPACSDGLALDLGAASAHVFGSSQAFDAVIRDQERQIREEREHLGVNPSPLPETWNVLYKNYEVCTSLPARASGRRFGGDGPKPRSMIPGGATLLQPAAIHHCAPHNRRT